MEEKFSVSLELMIQKFKDNAQKAQNIAQNVASRIKQNMSADVGSSAFKGMNAESELLLQKINDIKSSLNMAKTDNKLFSKTEILEMRVELEKLEQQYAKLNKQNNIFSSSMKNFQTGLNNSLKNAKRFTLSLFGLQSGFRLISRAMSAYSTIDQESANKTQAAWIGLGSMFAWLKDIIADFSIKAVSYINVFVKALTGVDFLSKAMAKSMNKASKSAGKLSKMLAGFDELTNLDDSAVGASDTDWINAFEKVKLDPKVTQWLENVANWLKKNKELIEQIGIIIGSVFVASKLTGFIQALSGTGTTGIYGALTLILATMGYLIIDAQNFKKELEESLKLAQKSRQEWVKTETDLDKIYNTMNVNRTSGYESLENSKGVLAKILGLEETYLDASKKVVENSKIDLETMQKQYETGKLTLEDKEKMLKNIKKQYDYNNKVIDALDKAGYETKELRDINYLYAGDISKIYDDLVKNGKKHDDIYKTVGLTKKEVENLKNEINNMANKKYSTEIEIKAKSNTKQAEKDYRNFFTRIGESLGTIINPLNWGSLGSKLKQIWSGGGYEKGLDFVPTEGYYHLHPGETVVPAGFTPEMHGLGGNNNEKTNKLLEELIDTLERKDMNAYISESEVGNASQNYRNKLSRIMGEELI